MGWEADFAKALVNTVKDLIWFNRRVGFIETIGPKNYRVEVNSVGGNNFELKIVLPIQPSQALLEQIRAVFSRHNIVLELSDRQEHFVDWVVVFDMRIDNPLQQLIHFVGMFVRDAAAKGDPQVYSATFGYYEASIMVSHNPRGVVNSVVILLGKLVMKEDERTHFVRQVHSSLKDSFPQLVNVKIHKTSFVFHI